MNLYHGSNLEVREPKIIPSKRLLDFAVGFYLTSDFEQARKWAIRTTNIRKTGQPMVSVFEVDKISLQQLKLLTFETANKDWLRFVAANRTGTPADAEYDIIIGPVANDQAIRTVNNYLKGYFPEDVAIQLLLPQKLKDQYPFLKEDACALLKFKEARAV